MERGRQTILSGKITRRLTYRIPNKGAEGEHHACVERRSYRNMDTGCIVSDEGDEHDQQCRYRRSDLGGNSDHSGAL
jgi:hypothetical protein